MLIVSTQTRRARQGRVSKIVRSILVIDESGIIFIILTTFKSEKKGEFHYVVMHEGYKLARS